MRTLVFCTAYAESQAAWADRWGRWKDSILGAGLAVDQVLIVDDGSPVLPDWPDTEIVPAESPEESEAAVCIHHFADRRGQHVDGEPFPGWYRSFAHAVLYGILRGYDRIIHIEADAFLISDRAVDFFNTCEQGWVALWCARHRWPESSLQVICRDQFGPCIEFWGRSYASHLRPNRPMETLIPYTRINKDLIGDRYGEAEDWVPFGADFVSRVRWNRGAEYYWWLDQAGERRPAAAYADFTDVLGQHAKTRDDDAGPSVTRFLDLLNQQLLPRGYLETGTQDGEALAVVSCDSICIDPALHIGAWQAGQRRRTLLFRMTPEEFFAEQDPTTLLGRIDLGFLRGCRHFEALLRQFIDFERHAHPGTLLLLPDCLPAGSDQPESAVAATGDLWRLLPVLKAYRPELTIACLDTAPARLVLCRGLDPSSTILADEFGRIIAKFNGLDLATYGLREFWQLYPMLDTTGVLAAPRLFCECFHPRRLDVHRNVPPLSAAVI